MYIRLSSSLVISWVLELLPFLLIITISLTKFSIFFWFIISIIGIGKFFKYAGLYLKYPLAKTVPVFIK